jgi:hypothetical protein
MKLRKVDCEEGIEMTLEGVKRRLLMPCALKFRFYYRSTS